MRIFVLQPIKDFFGNEVKHPEGQKATFRTVAVECLTWSLPPLDTGKDSKYSNDLYNLAKKIADSEFVELTIEDLATIKARVTAAGYTHLVKGRVYEILEGQNKECLNG